MYSSEQMRFHRSESLPLNWAAMSNAMGIYKESSYKQIWNIKIRKEFQKVIANLAGK